MIRLERDDFLNYISEIRMYCGFRENMMQQANRPFGEADFYGLFADILNVSFKMSYFVYPFDAVCIWDPSIVINDAARWYVLNATGTKDAKGHEVSEDIKEMPAYMNGSLPKSPYAKMLDEAVKEVKRSEERRLEYMTVYAQEIE